MQTLKWLFNSLNYGFYCLYSFTLIDVVKKVIFNQFNLSNATNFVQLILTIIGVIFAYFRLISYIRDSRIKSRMLEEDLKKLVNQNKEFNLNVEVAERLMNEKPKEK